MADTYWKALDKVRATEDWKARTLAALERAPARPRMRVLPRVLAAAGGGGPRPPPPSVWGPPSSTPASPSWTCGTR